MDKPGFFQLIVTTSDILLHNQVLLKANNIKPKNEIITFHSWELWLNRKRKYFKKVAIQGKPCNWRGYLRAHRPTKQKIHIQWNIDINRKMISWKHLQRSSSIEILTRTTSVMETSLAFSHPDNSFTHSSLKVCSNLSFEVWNCLIPPKFHAHFHYR